MLDLVESIECGDIEKVKHLLSLDSTDPNQKDQETGSTALHLAVELGYPDIVRQLMIHSKTNPNTFNRNGYSPFHLAVFNQDEECVEIFLSNKFVDINLQTRSYKRETVLHMAETEEILRLLLRRSDLNVNIQDSHGQTPLHIFSYRCNENRSYFGETLIPILLEARHDVNPFLLDQSGKSPDETAALSERNEYGEHEPLTIQETILNFQHVKKKKNF